jgi:hypothetical protein
MEIQVTDISEGMYDVTQAATVDTLEAITVAIFKHMTPQNIADKLLYLDPDDMSDTFKAITQLPEFRAWYHEGGIPVPEPNGALEADWGGSRTQE